MNIVRHEFEPPKRAIAEWTRAEPDQDSEGIDLKEVVSVLLRNWMLLTIGLALGLASGFGWQRLQPRIFEATAMVSVEQQGGRVLDFQEVVSGVSSERSAIATQAAIIRSQQLLERVARRLQLVNDPEFNTALRPKLPPTWVEIAAAWLSSQANYVFENAGVRTPAPVGVPLPADAAQMADFDPQLRAVVATLKRRVKVTTGTGDYIISIAAQSEDATKAAAIANTVAAEYILDQLEAKEQATARASEWLGQRVVDMRARASTTQQAVQDLRRQIGAVGDESQTEVLGRFEQLRVRRERLREDATALRERRDTLRDAVARRDWAAAATIAPRAGGKSPRVEAFQPALAALNRDLDTAEARARLADEEFERISTSLEAQAALLTRLRQAESEAETARVMFQTLLGRAEETSLQAQLQTPDARLLERAEPVFQPVAPRGALVTALSGVGALAVLLGGVFAARLFDTRVKTKRDVEIAAGEMVAAVLPYDRNATRYDRVAEVIRGASSGALPEAMRYLRTTIRLSNIDTPPKVVAVTSSIPGEGKSVTAFALATVAAQSGARTLLIDADMRRPVLHKLAKLSTEKGLLSILEGDDAAEAAWHKDENLPLFMIPTRSATSNAHDLLSSKRFKDLITEMREAFDFIVIDLPPVLSVPDALSASQHADLVVQCVRWNKTTRDALAESTNTLRAAQCARIEIAMTCVDLKKLGGYSYGYYAGGVYASAKKAYAAG